MKRLALHLVTANFSGTIISLVVFLINTFRLDVSEYFVYGYINSALMIGGLLVAFGTDNLALTLYDKQEPETVFGYIRSVKGKMLLPALLFYLGSGVYLLYQYPNYPVILILTCYLFSSPFLLSFYYTDTHSYIHKDIYNKFVKVSFFTKLFGLVPILIAAYFQKFLLITALLANSATVILPALKFQQGQKRNIDFGNKIFSGWQVFENFVLNSYPVLYVNAAFFLFTLVHEEFLSNKLVVYTSRIFIILAGVAGSILSLVISSNVAKTTIVIKRIKPFLMLTAGAFGAAIILYRFVVPISEPYYFIGWNCIELIGVSIFFVLFFCNAYNRQQRMLVPSVFVISFLFFFFTKIFITKLDDLMLSRAVFVGLLIVVNILSFKKYSGDEKAIDS